MSGAALAAGASGSHPPQWNWWLAPFRSRNGVPYWFAPAIAETARVLWEKEGVDNAHISVGDVAEAELEDAPYDVVLCLYFTPGNFRDKSDDLGLYSDAYLVRNPQFIRVVSLL